MNTVLCIASNHEQRVSSHPYTHTQKQSMWGFPLLADGNKKHKAVCIGVNYVAKTAAGS